jgi:GPH family glycoside/pentoside/hexuronide:cation symporter
MVKFGFAIAGGLTGLILSLVGFTSGALTQPVEAIIGLRLFFSGLPILGTLVAIYVMRDYEITEEKATEISKILLIRRDKTK